MPNHSREHLATLAKKGGEAMKKKMLDPAFRAEFLARTRKAAKQRGAKIKARGLTHE